MKSDHKNLPQSNLINKETLQPYEIPMEGSLALLALGAVGLKAWRDKKQSMKVHKNLDENKL